MARATKQKHALMCYLTDFQGNEDPRRGLLYLWSVFRRHFFSPPLLSPTARSFLDLLKNKRPSKLSD